MSVNDTNSSSVFLFLVLFMYNVSLTLLADKFKITNSLWLVLDSYIYLRKILYV